MSEKSESIKELAAALAKAQSVMEGAKKDSSNPHFKSKYADLESVWDAARKPLSDNGLSVVQIPMELNERNIMSLKTMLIHTSGEYIGGIIEIPVSRADAQGIGSAITYARRYALASIVGISPEDDDGEGAVGRSEKHHQHQTSHTPPPAEENKVGTKLMNTLLDWCHGDEQEAALRLKQYSEFEKDGKTHSLKLADLANPKYAKWCGSTLGRLEKAIKESPAEDQDIPF